MDFMWIIKKFIHVLNKNTPITMLNVFFYIFSHFSKIKFNIFIKSFTIFFFWVKKEESLVLIILQFFP